MSSSGLVSLSSGRGMRGSSVILFWSQSIPRNVALISVSPVLSPPGSRGPGGLPWGATGLFRKARRCGPAFCPHRLELRRAAGGPPCANASGFCGFEGVQLHSTSIQVVWVMTFPPRKQNKTSKQTKNPEQTPKTRLSLWRN